MLAQATTKETETSNEFGGHSGALVLEIVESQRPQQKSSNLEQENAQLKNQIERAAGISDSYCGAQPDI